MKELVHVAKQADLLARARHEAFCQRWMVWKTERVWKEKQWKLFLGSGKQLCKNVSSDWGALFPTCSLSLSLSLARVLPAGCVGVLVLGLCLLSASQPAAGAAPALALSGILALQTFLCRCLPASRLQVSAMPLVLAEFLLGVFLGRWTLQCRPGGHPALWSVSAPCQSARFLFCVTQKFQNGILGLAKHSNATIVFPSVLLMAWGPKFWQEPPMNTCLDVNMCITRRHVYTSVFHQTLSSYISSWSVRDRYKGPKLSAPCLTGEVNNASLWGSYSKKHK